MQQALYIHSSKKREFAKLIISIALGLALLFAGFIFVNRVFERADFYDRFEGFYTSDTEYDILFCGNSHTYKSVAPMQLWKDYGITSYVLGSPGLPTTVTYYMFKNAIKHKKPKIAVLEVYQREIMGSATFYVSQAHQYFDTIPLSLEKYKAISEICPENKAAVNELIFPLSTYHNRWKEMTGTMIKNGFGIKDDSENYVTTAKGQADFYPAVYKPVYENVLVSSDDYDKEHLNDFKAQYIEKFIELCKGNDITPVVFAAPFDADRDMQRWINAYLKAAENKGAATLNLFHEDVINPYIDYSDDDHLNPAGAIKVTEYLGKYLTENYALEDKRSNSNFQSWNEDYDKYVEYLAKLIKEDNSYIENLVYLKSEAFTCELEYTDAHDIEKADEVEQMLIEQLGDRITCKKASKIIIEDWDNTDKATGKPSSKEVDIKLTIYDAETGGEIITKYYKNEATAELIKSE